MLDSRDASMVTVNVMQSSAHTSDPQWEPLTSDTLSPEAIRLLLTDDVPYVRIPNFLEPNWCAEVSRRYVERLKEFPENEWEVGPCKLKSLVGPLDLVMHSDDMSAYFATADKESARVREIYEGGEDPLAKLRKNWEDAGYTHQIAAEDGRPYLPDLIWSLIDSGRQAPHVDTYQSDRVTSLSRYGRRISWNLFLQEPDSGGGFIVYQRRKQRVTVVGPDGMTFEAAGPEIVEDMPWNAEPEQILALMEGYPSADYTPVCGDLIIFDACNYHDVMANTGHRIVGHSNIAVDPIERDFAFYV